MLTDVNSSHQQVEFTMPVGAEKKTKDGITYAKRTMNAEPQMFFLW
jgi:hypothetical protein